MLQFKFATATDITSFAKEHYPDFFGDYEKVFITPDSNDYHILRVLKGFDEDYEECEDSWVLEVNLIPRTKKLDLLSVCNLKSVLMGILQQDNGDQYGYTAHSSYDEVIDKIDGGFGIL